MNQSVWEKLNEAVAIMMNNALTLPKKQRLLFFKYYMNLTSFINVSYDFPEHENAFKFLILIMLEKLISICKEIKETQQTKEIIGILEFFIYTFLKSDDEKKEHAIFH